MRNLPRAVIQILQKQSHRQERKAESNLVESDGDGIEEAIHLPQHPALSSCSCRYLSRANLHPAPSPRHYLIGADWIATHNSGHERNRASEVASDHRRGCRARTAGRRHVPDVSGCQHRLCASRSSVRNGMRIEHITPTGRNKTPQAMLWPVTHHSSRPDYRSGTRAVEDGN